MVSRHRLFPILLALIVLVTVAPVAAQPASPVSSPAAESAPLDLAAMTLTAEAMPSAYVLGAEDAYRVPEAVGLFAGEIATPAEIAATGLRQTYVTTYETSPRSRWIRMYVEEYDSVDGVSAGFALFEDEARWTQAFGSGSEVEDLPREPDVGEAPRETTVGVLRYDDGSDSVVTTDVTFRVGRVLAGVAVENLVGLSLPDDPQFALGLAKHMEARIRMVLAGNAPPGTDPLLRELVLPLADTWREPGYWGEGYRGAGEVLYGYFDLAAYDAFLAGFARSVPAGSGPASADWEPPFVTIGLSAYASAEAAAAILDGARELQVPAYLNWGGFRRERDPPSIPGTDAVRAFVNALEAGQPFDSARIVFRAGTRVVTVDVQGVASAEQALAIAVDLATQQAACLTTGGPCAAVTVPAAMSAPKATPAASPVA